MSHSSGSSIYRSAKYCVLAASLMGALLAASPAMAVFIVNDTWRDDTDTDPAAPTYSENGTDTDLDGDLESAWYQGGAGTLNPVVGGGPGPQRGDLTGTTASASWTTYFTPDATPVTLGLAGDKMRLTWVFTPTTIGGANTSQNFRFGIVDTPLAARLVANGSPGSAAYTGYSIFGNMAGTLGNSAPFALRERFVASGDMFTTSGNWGANGVANANLANGATTGNTGYVSGTQYSLVWTMTRTGAGGILHDITMTGGSLDNDGAATISVTDPSPNMGSFSFDTFTLRPSGSATTALIFDTSLFSVEFIGIPELASGVTWAGICLIGAGLRRRHVGAA